MRISREKTQKIAWNDSFVLLLLSCARANNVIYCEQPGKVRGVIKCITQFGVAKCIII